MSAKDVLTKAASANADELIILAKQSRSDIIEILEACTCQIPIRVWGVEFNGHTPDCESVGVIKRIRERGGFA